MTNLEIQEHYVTVENMLNELWNRWAVFENQYQDISGEFIDKFEEAINSLEVLTEIAKEK